MEPCRLGEVSETEYTAYLFNRLTNLGGDPIGVNQSFRERHTLSNRENQLNGEIEKMEPCRLGGVSGTGTCNGLKAFLCICSEMVDDVSFGCSVQYTGLSSPARCHFVIDYMPIYYSSTPLNNGVQGVEFWDEFNRVGRERCNNSEEEFIKIIMV
ncbi:hypothetical protein JTB14_019363 [Gonioctena quinquepunctata]|nr:hypothetical protein JTB14_019363 [Gonioctena quinquepunctata]